MSGSSSRLILSSLILATVVCGAAVQIGLLWFSSIPLGIPGEWVWPRLKPIVPLLAMIWPAMLMGAVLAGYVCLNALNFNHFQRRSRGLLLLGLWGIGIVWILSLVGSAPGIAGLNRIPFVLFYTRSSGYFTQAYEHRHNVREFLKGYRERIEDSSNPENHLHLGTHPPGLTSALIGMMWMTENVPGVSSLFTVTQPQAFQESVETIRQFELANGKPPTLQQNEAAVLWMAALLTAVMAAGTCLPLYLLARRFVDPSTAWWGAGCWLLVPAIPIFLPKSDVCFPLLAMGAQFLWLTALDRNRFSTGFWTGVVMCVALSLTLAFSPIALMFLLQGIVLTVLSGPLSQWKSSLIQRWRPPVGAIVALLAWLLVCGIAGQMNLLGIWIQNLKNHAAFYAHNVRTYPAWLLEIPIELAFSLGLPVAILAVLGVVGLFRQHRGEHNAGKRWELLIPVAVWLVLWLSGKNMGEAARLWVFLMPYALWCATLGIQKLNGTRSGWRVLSICFLVQLVVAIATAIRIDGFGFEELRM
ncbi:MAG TPA: hypothetical protein VNQ76_21585 [Planctomicrobium sp.]|nr:hypothetical protein [Planctomicrobium sp.]